jgi:integrase
MNQQHFIPKSAEQTPKPIRIKKQKIKNPNYNKFLKEGIIDLLSPEHIKSALDNIELLERPKKRRIYRAFLICLYYSGARPNEVLNLKAKDIYLERQFVRIKLPASKGGLPRTISILKKTPFIMDVYNYTKGLFPDLYIFWSIRTTYVRKRINKKGELKEYNEISDGVRYHLYKWFRGVVPNSIPPYFLRHNRFSNLAMKGIKLEGLRMWKGSKTFNSIIPYLHMSTAESENIAKKLN